LIDTSQLITVDRRLWFYLRTIMETSAAVYETALAGELGVCRFLWEHGAAFTIRTKKSFD